MGEEGFEGCGDAKGKKKREKMTGWESGERILVRINARRRRTKGGKADVLGNCPNSSALRSFIPSLTHVSRFVALGPETGRRASRGSSHVGSVMGLEHSEQEQVKK